MAVVPFRLRPHIANGTHDRTEARKGRDKEPGAIGIVNAGQLILFMRSSSFRHGTGRRIIPAAAFSDPMPSQRRTVEICEPESKFFLTHHPVSGKGATTIALIISIQHQFSP
jgi:hypothetical protein